MNDPETTTEAQPTDGMADLRAFLEDLVPDSEQVKVKDARGREVVLNTTLPARRHIRALRMMDDLVKAATSLGPTDGEPRKLLAVLRSGLHNDDVLEKLGAVFAVAYPEAVHDAGKGVIDGADVLDLFPLEALLEGVLPLASRLLVKALTVANKAGTMGQPTKSTG